MQIPVWIERVGGNGYRACTVAGPGVAAEGNTRDEAIQGIRDAIQQRLAEGGELIQVEVPSQPSGPRIVGIFKDNPLFDEWQRAIAEYRDQVEKDPTYR